MKTLPTQPDLTALGWAVFEDGLAAHAGELSSLAQLIATVAPDDQVAAIMADPDAPEVVRARALAHVTGSWSRYHRALVAASREDFEAAFTELLDAWRTHEQLRVTAAPTAELFASRMALDSQRERVGFLRRRLAGTIGRATAVSPKATCA